MSIASLREAFLQADVVSIDKQVALRNARSVYRVQELQRAEKLESLRRARLGQASVDEEAAWSSVQAAESLMQAQETTIQGLRDQAYAALAARQAALDALRQAQGGAVSLTEDVPAAVVDSMRIQRTLEIMKVMQAGDDGIDAIVPFALHQSMDDLQAPIMAASSANFVVNVPLMLTESATIGTDSAAKLLTVKGAANVSGNTSVGGNLSVEGNASVSGNATVLGSLTVLGDAVYVQSTNLQINDNIVEINKGLTGVPPGAMQSGFEILRGSSASHMLLFDETAQTFVVGPKAGTLQRLATREDAPSNTKVASWDNANRRFVTTGSLLTNNSQSVASGRFGIGIGLEESTSGYQAIVKNTGAVGENALLNLSGRMANYYFISNSSSGYNTTFLMDDNGLFISGNSSSRHIHLQTGGSTRMTVQGGGDVVIPGKVRIGGTSNPAQALDVTGNLAVSGTSNLNNNVTIASGRTLTVGGTSTFSDNVSIASAKTLTVGGTSSFSDSVTIASGKNLSVGGGLTVTGTSTLNNNVTIGSGRTLTVGGTSTLNDNVTIATGKTLTVGGTSTFSDNVSIASAKTLTVGGTSSFSDSVTIASGKNLSVGGGLTVTGTSTLNSNVTIGSGRTLTVGGTSTLSDNVTIAAGKTLTVGGTSTFSDSVTIASGKNLSVGGGLTVTGTSTLNNNVTIGSAKTLTVGGTSSFSDSVTIASGKNLSVGGGLTVTGTSTLNNNVTIGSGRTLTVGGTSTLSDNVTIAAGKTLTVGGTSTFSDNVTIASGKNLSVGGGLTVTGASKLDSDVTIASGKKLTVGSDVTAPKLVLKHKTSSAETKEGDGIGSHAEYEWIKIEGGGDTGDVNAISAAVSMQSDTNSTVAPDGVMHFKLNKGATSANAFGGTPQQTVLTLSGSGAVTVPGSLGVSGATSVGGNATVAGTLGVTGATTLSGNASVGGTLVVTGASSSPGNGHFYTGATNPTATTRLNYNGNLHATNLATLTNATVGGTLTVTSGTTLSSTLSAGASTLSSLGVTNNATVGGTLTVTSGTTLSSTLSAGASTLSSLGVTNNATVGGVLTVNGTTKTNGAFYKGTSAPTNTTRLNYDGALHVQALTAAGEVTAHSDARLKHHVSPIDGAAAADAISRMQGVYYEMIGDEKRTRHIGFIAQDVEGVLPEIVKVEEATEAYPDGLRSLAYDRVVCVLLEAVKELTGRVKALEAGCM